MTTPVPLSDLELPRAAILRILKKSVLLPWMTAMRESGQNASRLNAQKDAKLALTKAGTLFISYLTAAYEQPVALTTLTAGASVGPSSRRPRQATRPSMLAMCTRPSSRLALPSGSSP